MLKRLPTVLLLVLAACSGGGTGPVPVDLPIIAVGMARIDRSPTQTLTGYLAFFYDADNERLLTATVQINQLAIEEVIEPGVVEGPIYFRGSTVRAGDSYRLVATIQSLEGAIQVASATVIAPAVFEIRAPATIAVGQGITVTWDPVVTEAFNVNVTSTGFEAELPGSATSFTVPASAFAGLQPGQTAEIEVTAFNGFYVSLSSSLSDLQDAEEAVLKFSEAENITGGGVRGSFGAATTVGVLVIIQ